MVPTIIAGNFALLLTVLIAMVKLVGDRIGEVGHRIDDLRVDMGHHIDDLRADVGHHIEDLRADTQANFTRIDAELSAIRSAIVDLGERVTRLEAVQQG